MSNLTFIMYEDTQYPVTCQIEIPGDQSFIKLKENERNIIVNNIINYYIKSIEDPNHNKIVKCILTNDYKVDP